MKLTPGQVISVDQLSSDTPGYVVQMTRTPTRHIYVGGTIFVDQATHYTYLHLQYSLDVDDTLKEKGNSNNL